jgi:hypothetical protein
MSSVRKAAARAAYLDFEQWVADHDPKHRLDLREQIDTYAAVVGPPPGKCETCPYWQPVRLLFSMAGRCERCQGGRLSWWKQKCGFKRPA